MTIEKDSEADKIGTDGTMKYLDALGVGLEEPVLLAVLTEISAPTMGEIDREGFVSGWEKNRAETLPKQKAAVPKLRGQLRSDPDYFRTVYRHSFILARSQGQRAVALDAAIEFWRMLFSDGGIKWQTPHTEWLDLWVKFLESKWKKSINKDLWEQTGIFARKTLDDESMSFWNEESSWPSVIDEFVAYVKEERAANVKENSDNMEL